MGGITVSKSKFSGESPENRAPTASSQHRSIESRSVQQRKGSMLSSGRGDLGTPAVSKFRKASKVLANAGMT